MSPDAEGWLRTIVSIGGSFAAAWSAVNVRLSKIETWMRGHEKLVEERHTSNVARLEHIDHKLGNGTPGVFLRRDEAERMVETRDFRFDNIERRIGELEDK